MTDNHAAVAALLRPRTVTIVGASERPDSWPARIRRNLRAFAFPGPVYLVNPRHSAIDGEPCYPSVSAVPGEVDHLVVLVPAPAVAEVVAEAGRRGARSATVFSGGFGEGGDTEGQARGEAVRAAAAASGVRLCGPNCLGNVAPREGAVTFAEQAIEPFQPGGFGLVAQSGGIGGAVLRYAAQRGIGVSYGVLSGNELDLELADYVAFLADDPATSVIGLFIEGVRTPARFLAACLAARRAGKPIVALKVGGSAEGRAAALAHTGAVAGSPAVFAAVCRRYGIVQVNSPDEMVETVELLLHTPPLKGDGVVLATLSGGARGLLADLSAELGLSLPPLAPTTVRALEERLGVGTSIGNPLDIGWGALSSRESYLACVEALLADPALDVLAVQEELPRGPDQAARAETCQALAAVAARAGKPLVFYSRASYRLSEYALAYRPSCLTPFLQETRRTLQALRHAVDYGAAVRRPLPVSPSPPQSEGKGTGWRARLAALDAPLPPLHAAALLAAYDIPTPPQHLAQSPTAAAAAARALGFPVALKTASPQVAHKTEAGGVRLGLGTAAAVREAYGAVTAVEPAAGALVQAMVPTGVEVVLAALQDPQWGPVLLFGLGGVFVELFGDRSLRLPPLDADDARAMIAETRAGALLASYRGRPRADEAALVAAIQQLGILALELGDSYAAIEINPLVVLPEGEGVYAVDVLVLPRGRHAVGYDWLLDGQRE